MSIGAHITVNGRPLTLGEKQALEAALDMFSRFGTGQLEVAILDNLGARGVVSKTSSPLSHSNYDRARGLLLELKKCVWDLEENESMGIYSPGVPEITLTSFCLLVDCRNPPTAAVDEGLAAILAGSYPADVLLAACVLAKTHGEEKEKHGYDDDRAG